MTYHEKEIPNKETPTNEENDVILSDDISKYDYNTDFKTDFNTDFKTDFNTDFKTDFNTDFNSSDFKTDFARDDNDEKKSSGEDELDKNIIKNKIEILDPNVTENGGKKTESLLFKDCEKNSNKAEVKISLAHPKSLRMIEKCRPRLSFIQNMMKKAFLSILTKRANRRFNLHKYSDVLDWENLHLKTSDGLIGMYLFYGQRKSRARLEEDGSTSNNESSNNMSPGASAGIASLSNNEKNVRGGDQEQGNFLPPSTKIILFLHGMKCDRKDVLDILDLSNLVYMDFIVCIPDYRGFGDSTGEFERGAVTRDVDDIVDYLHRRFAREIVVVGHSMGTGVALEYMRHVKTSGALAGDYKIGLKYVLIAPFTSLIENIKASRPYQLISKVYRHLDHVLDLYEYNNLENIRHGNRENILICHGYQDINIPIAQSLKLVDYASEFVRINNDDHISICSNQEVWDMINVFVRCGI